MRRNTADTSVYLWSPTETSVCCEVLWNIVALDPALQRVDSQHVVTHHVSNPSLRKDIFSEGHVMRHPWHLPMTPTQQSPTESIDQHTGDMSDRHSNETMKQAQTNSQGKSLPYGLTPKRLCFTSHVSASSWFYQLRSPQRRTQLANPASLAGTNRRNIIPRGCWFYQLRSPQRRTQLANPASLVGTNRRNIIPRGCEFLFHLYPTCCYTYVSQRGP